MAHINLLPWRQEERARRNKEFIRVVVAITLLALSTIFVVWSYFNKQLDEQLTANVLIKQENSRLDAVLIEIDRLEERRGDIISRVKVIQDLQGRRPVPVRLWDDIAKAIPPTLYLSHLKREGDLITLTGLADNPNVVSSLIRNLDNSNWMDNSAVSNIQQNITAYQPAPTSNETVTTSETTRPRYPEDSYVQFIITAQIPSWSSSTDTAAINTVDKNSIAKSGDGS